MELYLEQCTIIVIITYNLELINFHYSWFNFITTAILWRTGITNDFAKEMNKITIFFFTSNFLTSKSWSANIVTHIGEPQEIVIVFPVSFYYFFLAF